MIITKRRSKDHWDKIISSGPDLCAICDKKPKKGTRLNYWGLHKKTEEPLYRHNHCYAGSANWIKKFDGWVGNDFKYLGKKIIESKEVELEIKEEGGVNNGQTGEENSNHSPKKRTIRKSKKRSKRNPS